jgi:hypothetical protein
MDSIGTSFKAQLLCITEGFRGPVAMTRGGGIAKQGWLVRGGGSEQAVTFNFEYLERVEERLLFTIRGAEDAGDYHGAPLDVSRNGYLGFYSSVDDPSTWQLEVTRDDGDGKPLRCRLRDAGGHRIAMLSKTSRSGSRADAYFANGQRIDYLTRGNGVAVEFEIRYQD